MEATSTEVQNNFGTYLKLAQVEDVYITRNNKFVAVLRYCEDQKDVLESVAEGKAVYHSGELRISVEEFRKLSVSSENRYELIDGELFQQASPSYEHQRIIGELFNRFYEWAREKECKPVTAPFDVTILKDSVENVVQPDIVFVCDQEMVDEKGRYNGIPTVVVEVLSESTRNKDMLKKLNLYMAGGVREYWIVNPGNQEIYIYLLTDRQITNYRVFKGAETASSEVLSNLSVPLEHVFSVMVRAANEGE